MKSNLFFRRLLLLWVFAFSASLWGQTTIVSEGLNNSSSLFTFSSVTNGGYFTGNSTTSDKPSLSPLASEGTHAYGVTNGKATLTSTNIDTSQYDDISLSFRVAAFSIGSTGNGIDGTDTLIAEISSDGGVTYTKMITLSGGTNATWSYADGKVGSAEFPTSAMLIAGTGTSGYSTIIITNLPKSTTLKIKISLLNNAAAERWLLDDFIVKGTPVIVSEFPPVVTASNLTGTVGATFVYQIEATETPDSYLIFSGILPTGLNLDTTSGIISGTPSAAGNFNSTITATNVAGTSDAAAFVFTIEKGTQTAVLPNLNATLEDTQFTLPVNTDKGLPIEYVSNDESVATVSGNILNIVGLGSTEIFAGNEGDANYDLYADSFMVNVTDVPAGPCGLENFDNSASTTSYSDGSFVGNGDISWVFTNARDEGDYPIDGKGLMFQSIGNNLVGNAGAGIGTLSFQARKAFTGGSNNRQLKIYINGILKYTTAKFGTSGTDATVYTFDIDDINTAGIVNIKIENAGPQVTIDNITWTCFANPSTTWDGAAWSNGLPDATKDAIIAGDYNQPSAAGIVAKSITVNDNTTFIVYPYVNTGDVTNNGQIIVSSYGNFVHNGAFHVGEGSSFKVSRTSKAVKRYDYIAWSSPLKDSPQTLKQFSYGSNNFENQSTQGTANNRFYKYNEGNYVTTPHTGIFNPAGQGFQIRTPNDFSETVATNFWGLFVGTEPNVGEITYNASAIDGQYVFLGNPYPSALDMEQFFVENNQITGAFYIWDSGNAMDAGTNEYLGSNYNTYNKTGTVPANAENGYVPVGQGFFVDRGSNTIPNFKYTNAMRSIDRGGSFSKAVSDRFWLQMTAPSGAKPQMLIGFHQNATSGYDAGYDAKMFDSNADVIYSTVEGKSLIIDAHGAFTDTDVINVTANFLAVGNYTIGIAQKEGVFANTQQIYLKDNLTGTETELTAGDYTFAATAGLQADRFTVSFNKGVLASSNTTKGQSIVYASDQIVYVNASSKIASVEVYDMSGKLIKKSSVSNSQTTSFPVSYKGITVVKLALENGEIVTKKIILK